MRRFLIPAVVLVLVACGGDSNGPGTNLTGSWLYSVSNLTTGGLTCSIETPSALRSFLERWRRRKPGAVLHIITGKGLGSANGPVLRGLVKNLLQGEFRTMVAQWDLDHAEGGYKVRLR